MNSITTVLIVIAVLLGLYGILLGLAFWFVYVEWRRKNKEHKQVVFCLAEISKSLGGRPFIVDPEKIETRVVINDVWDDEKEGKD